MIICERERKKWEREAAHNLDLLSSLTSHQLQKKSRESKSKKTWLLPEYMKKKNTNKLQHNRETPSQFNDPSCISLKWDRATHQVWKFSSFPHKAQNALSSWIIACRLLPIHYGMEMSVQMRIIWGAMEWKKKRKWDFNWFWIIAGWLFRSDFNYFEKYFEASCFQRVFDD